MEQQNDEQQHQFGEQHFQHPAELTACGGGGGGGGDSASSSPRRRKAPFDIDAALRLQSQASYVQEPARGAASCSSSQAPPSGGGSGSNASKPPLGDSALARHGAAALSTNQYYYDQNQLFGNNSSNISVDYIDCLSNDDLVLAPQPRISASFGGSQHLSAAAAAAQRQPATQSAAAAMRGIPSCRKHFGRFHRANRVEPNEQQRAAAAAAAAAVTATSAAEPTSGAGPALSGPDSTSNSVITDESASFEQQNRALAGGPSEGQLRATSVLYPISVSEVKKRTYFIGSVSQDSLLSHDELYRYFPNGRVSIFVCTWNQNRKRAPSNLNDLLLPEQLAYMPDVYAIGIQEAFSSQQDYLRDWEIELQTTLGPSHVLLHSCSLGTLHLALFIRRDLIWFCSTPEESLYNSRSMPTNMIKTKGAISIAFRFFGTSFMFTNCHFPAHEHKLKDRIDEYQRIINSIDLPKNLKLLKPRYLSNDSTARFDCVFFMGDLNFRLEQRTFDETIQILEDIFQSREQSFEALTQNDELLKAMESQRAFYGFDESPIKFPPTYKFLAQTNKYDRQTKRVPSYTDRILFRSKRQRHIHCLVYDWLPQLLSSDHKPVYCLFDVLIRPGHEQNMVGSLNAGLFQRTVYLEALKRRAEDPDGVRENGVGGNLICSIS